MGQDLIPALHDEGSVRNPLQHLLGNAQLPRVAYQSDLVLSLIHISRWTILAPVFVPLFMLMGYTPELTQMAYRIGDSCTNVITPLMSYFAMVTVLAQKYAPKAGVGTPVSYTQLTRDERNGIRILSAPQATAAKNVSSDRANTSKKSI